MRKREAPGPRARDASPWSPRRRERTAGQSLRVLPDTPGSGPRRIKLAGAWAEARVPGAGDAARTARSRGRPAGLCPAPFPSTSPAPIGTARALPPVAAARSPRPARARPAPPRSSPEPGLEAWRVLAPSCQRPRPLSRSWRASSCRRSGRTEGEGRGASAAELEWMVLCASCASSQDNIKRPWWSDRWFSGPRLPAGKQRVLPGVPLRLEAW